jgi:hypothetical protein
VAQRLDAAAQGYDAVESQVFEAATRKK